MKNTVVFYKQYIADALEQLAFNTLYTALHNCLSNFLYRDRILTERFYYIEHFFVS